MPIPTGASPSIRSSSCGGRRHIVPIRCGSRPATARRIPTVILERRKPVIGVSASLEFWPWLAVAGLGAFHGLNPSMGWLFAVALGLHRQDRRIVWLALLPIALGHAVSVAAVALVFLWVGWFVDGWAFRVGAALILIGWALYHWRFSHRHRVRFRHAGGGRRSLRVVVSDGGCPWRRPDVVAGPDAAVSPQRCRRGAG